MPTGPFQEMYDTEAKGMVRGWEVLILNPVNFGMGQNIEITLKKPEYDGQVIIVKSWEKYNNPGSTIPVYLAIQCEEYVGTGQ